MPPPYRSGIREKNASTLSGARSRSDWIERCSAVSSGSTRRVSKDEAAPETRSPATVNSPRSYVCSGVRCLQVDLARGVEQNINDCSLRWREEHLVDERLALVATAVATDELVCGSRESDVEDSRVRRVHDVQTNDLAGAASPANDGFPVDQHDVAETSHRGEVRASLVERGDVSILDQQVVQSDEQSADRRLASTRHRSARR